MQFAVSGRFGLNEFRLGLGLGLETSYIRNLHKTFSLNFSYLPNRLNYVKFRCYAKHERKRTSSRLLMFRQANYVRKKRFAKNVCFMCT